jgi:hypothetical protein
MVVGLSAAIVQGANTVTRDIDLTPGLGEARGDRTAMTTWIERIAESNARGVDGRPGTSLRTR